MCGIVGQLRPAGQTVDPELLARMCAGLEHRGPDSRGLHHGGRAGLGIQRLRVIDLSTGDQPIYNEDRSVVVVMNGEIYNYRELRDDLAGRGHTLRHARATPRSSSTSTRSTAPTACATCTACSPSRCGTSAASSCMIARDRVGKKPLLYALRDGVLSFASEMQALLQDTDIPREVDHVALDRYLALGYVPAPLTALRDVRKLPPAHTLVMRDGKVTLERYWALDYAHKLDEPVEELCERIREGLLAATRRRLIADVPLGAFLSGGIDSSAVVAAMAQLSSEPVRTFSIGFDHEGFDELPHARQIARQFGTVHEEFQVRAEAVEVLPQIVRHYGEPFADSSAIPSFYLAELTRRHVTVALNGDGGDESFAGYQRYVANAVAGRLDRLPAPLRRALAAAGGRVADDGDVSSVRNRVRRLAGGMALDAPARYARYVSWFDGAQRGALYSAELRGGDRRGRRRRRDRRPLGGDVRGRRSSTGCSRSTPGPTSSTT